MARGKSVEGVGFALQCAVFGRPPTMTRTEELYLELNPEIGRAVQTHSMVEAAAISAGRVGPWAYYLMLAAGDAKAASKMQAHAMLLEMMNGRR